MKIKKKENCIEGGNRSWFLLTCDYASLQARLASIDCCINPSTYGNPDPVLYEVYRDGSKTSDLHSMTGFGTFVGSTKMEAIRVKDDVDGKDYVFCNMSKCKVLRDGKEIDISAEDLKPTDHIIEHL